MHYVYNMQKEYVFQFYKTINKLLCNLSFAGQYIMILGDYNLHLLMKMSSEADFVSLLCCERFEAGNGGGGI